MASKKHRKKLKRIHLRYNAARYIERAERNFIEAMESLGKAAESAAKFLNIRIMEILKVNDGDDFITCESCTKQCTDIENMECDSGSNWFCPECWEELAPGLKAEYEELKAKGEID
jgi:hypothetical protein